MSEANEAATSRHGDEEETNGGSSYNRLTRLQRYRLDHYLMTESKMGHLEPLCFGEILERVTREFPDIPVTGPGLYGALQALGIAYNKRPRPTDDSDVYQALGDILHAINGAMAELSSRLDVLEARIGEAGDNEGGCCG